MPGDRLLAERVQRLDGETPQARALGGGPLVEVRRIGRAETGQEFAVVQPQRGTEALAVGVLAGRGEERQEGADVDPEFAADVQGTMSRWASRAGPTITRRLCSTWRRLRRALASGRSPQKRSASASRLCACPVTARYASSAWALTETNPRTTASPRVTRSPPKRCNRRGALADPSTGSAR